METEWWRTFFDGPWQRRQLDGYPPEKTSREVDFILQALRPEDGSRILDMPCGEGRHSIELASRGYRVVGVDFKGDTLEFARDRASHRGVEVDFRVSDMREFSSPPVFDRAICFGGSFGYFDEEGNRQVLKVFSDCLGPGGVLLIDIHSTESLLPQFRERDWSWQGEGEDRVPVLQERFFNLETQRVEATWTTLTKNGPVSDNISIRIYGYRELSDLLHTAGFRGVDAVVTGTGEPFVLGSPRLSIVASK